MELNSHFIINNLTKHKTHGITKASKAKVINTEFKYQNENKYNTLSQYWYGAFFMLNR